MGAEAERGVLNRWTISKVFRRNGRNAVTLMENFMTASVVGLEVALPNGTEKIIYGLLQRL